jgi:hypothetical protein
MIPLPSVKFASRATAPRSRTTVTIAPLDDDNAAQTVALGKQGVFVAHPITFIKGQYNVLEWPACRNIETVLVHDEGSGVPAVTIRYSDKECR